MGEPGEKRKMQNQVDAFVRERSNYRTPIVRAPKREHSKPVVPQRPAHKSIVAKADQAEPVATKKKIPKLPVVTMAKELEASPKLAQAPKAFGSANLAHPKIHHPTLNVRNSVDGFGGMSAINSLRHKKADVTVKKTVQKPSVVKAPKLPFSTAQNEVVEKPQEPARKSLAEMMQAEIDAHEQASSVAKEPKVTVTPVDNATSQSLPQTTSFSPSSHSLSHKPAHASMNFSAMEEAFDSIIEESSDEDNQVSSANYSQAGAMTLPLANPFALAPVFTPETLNFDAFKQAAGKITDFSPKVAYVMAAIVLGIGILVGSQSVTQGSVGSTSRSTANSAANSSESAAVIDLPQKTQSVNAGYLANHVVAGDTPKTLAINDINLSARVLSSGLNDKGSVQLPVAGQDVSWYSGSHKPGEYGAMLMVGHAQAEEGPAVFANIGALQAGSSIVVERGDGKLYTYVVKAAAKVPASKISVDKLTTSIDSKKQGLNLMAPSGKYDAKTKTFSERTLVFAVEQ